MRRSQILTTSALVAFASALSLAGNPIPSDPNIVVIMVDDLDVLTMDTMLDSGLLPSFEQYVVPQSVEFRQSFVTDALCCPSRATFLSGQYTHNHRTYSTGGWNGSILQFDDSSTLPLWLQQAGYVTGHVGKYLNGYGFLSTMTLETAEQERVYWDGRVGPERRARIEPTYVPPGWSEWYGLLDSWAYCVANYLMNENGSVRFYKKTGEVFVGGEVTVPDTLIQDNYQTDVLTLKAQSFIQRNAQHPFFLSVAPLAPHIEDCRLGNAILEDDGPVLTFDDYGSLFQGTIRPAPRHADVSTTLLPLAREVLLAQPTFNESDYEDKPIELREQRSPLTPEQIDDVVRQFADRMASMLAVDDLVGTLVGQLHASGVLDNTVILFTSDNGWLYGQHRLSSKLLAYDESIRVPLFIRLPGKTPAASAERSSRAVLNTDLAPTIAALAGAAVPETVDGRSYVPLLEEPATGSWRKRFLVEHYLSSWDDEPDRPFNHYSLSAVRTTDEAPRVPLRLYIEHFGGMQLENGWYAERPPAGEFDLPSTPPDGPTIMLSPSIDAELYNKFLDPYEEENLLYGLEQRPNALQLQQEVDELVQWMKALAVCSNGSCQALEDW